MKVLLCCGAGMSSGFLASQMRKFAKKEKINLNVQAISQSELGTTYTKYDIVCIGPHLASQMETIKDICTNKPVLLIPKVVYSELDGGQLVKLCQNELK